MSLLGIDIGTTVTKALLVEDDGRRTASARRRSLARPHAGWVEADAEAVWDDAAACVADLLRERPAAREAIAGIGCCGFGNGCVLVDDRGRAVRPVIISSDARAAAIVADWNRRGVTDALFPLIQQSLWPGQTAALLAWLSRHEPGTVARATRALLSKDFVTLRLTGIAGSDFSDAGATGLLNVRDRRFDPRITGALGLDGVRHLLPTLRESSDLVGTLSPAAAERLGLRAGIPVAAGALDCEAAAVGSDATSPGVLSIIAGSWSINQTTIDRPLDDPRVMQTTVSAVPGKWTALECSPTAALNLDWCARQFAAPASGDIDFAAIDRDVSGVAPESSGVLFHPFLFGSNLSPEATGSFLNLTAGDGRPQLFRAVYEGIAFAHATHVDRLRAAGLAFEHGRIAGGLARSDVWTQLLSDVLGLRVLRADGPETGALGAALLAGVATGRWPNLPAAQRAMCGTASRFDPDARRRATYLEKYRHYRFAADCFAPLWCQRTRGPA